MPLAYPITSYISLTRWRYQEPRVTTAFTLEKNYFAHSQKMKLFSWITQFWCILMHFFWFLDNFLFWKVPGLLHCGGGGQAGWENSQLLPNICFWGFPYTSTKPLVLVVYTKKSFFLLLENNASNFKLWRFLLVQIIFVSKAPAAYIGWLKCDQKSKGPKGLK